MQLFNFKGQQNTITEALRVDIPEHAVISVSGSGGKTSLIVAWARELASSGRRTVISTTTHMANPSHTAGSPDNPYGDIPFIIVNRDTSECDNGAKEELAQLLDSAGIAIVVSEDYSKDGKAMSPPDWMMDYLTRSADAILIEADGARRMPLKWPADYEPVIPSFTDISVCVAGLAALGRPCSEVIYRAEHLPDTILAGKSTVDEQLIFAMLTAPDGGRKSDTGEFRIFLNQADTKELQEKSEHLQKMFAVCGIQSAWGSIGSD